MMWTTGLVIFAAALHLPRTRSLECYQCTDVTQMADCKSIVRCPAGYNCHSIFKSNKYTLGCTVEALCPTTNTSSVNGGSGTIVGRTITTAVQDDCSQCCNYNSCNRQLCQSEDPSCHDSGTLDCVSTAAVLNVCSDTVHANKVCKKFCGLCSLVDGNWSPWTSWSQCSVTCNNGTEMRTRTCTDPSPASGGSDCMGLSHQTRTCAEGLCPVNGGWSDWTSWSNCSVGCGIGLWRRHRSCSNPPPSHSGNNCVGDTKEDGICVMGGCIDGGWSSWDSWGTCTTSCDGGLQSRHRACANPSPSLMGIPCPGESNQVQQCSLTACANGGWSDWGSWGTCTTSCDGGLQSKYRTCTNPSPSLLGKPCPGESNQVQQCSLTACGNGGWSGWGSWGTCTESCDGGLQSRYRTCTNPSPSLLGKPCPGESNQVQQCSLTACANGGWSDWGSWGTCTTSCDGGLQSKYRTCTNPSPSLLGKPCPGESNQVQQCSLTACANERIGFTVYYPADTVLSGRITFIRVVTNEGGGYNNFTGDFTCPVSGVYFFNLNLIKQGLSSVSSVGCWIYRHSNKLVQAFIQPDLVAKNGYYGTGTSVFVHLSTGDIVHLDDCSSASTMYWYTSFSGFLIKAD